MVPAFILNANAMGCAASGCQLDTITHVPPADKVVRVQLDGAGIFGLNHTFTFANDTTHTILVLDTSFIGASSGMRYTFKEWDYAGQQFATNPMTTPPMYTNYTVAQCQPGPPALNCPFVAVFTISPPLGCKTNCYMDASTNVPPADGTIRVQADSSLPVSLSHTFAFANGTVHTIQVLNSTFTGASSGAKYTWKQWSCACSGISPTSSATLTTPTMYSNYTSPTGPYLNGVGGFTTVFDRQFKLTLNFVDPSGSPVSAPAFVTLTSGSTVMNVTLYSGQWTSAASWTVTDAMWEGVKGMVVGSPTIDLTNGAVTTTITLKAYSASVKTVDGSNNPVSGVTVTVSFANSTSKTFTTDSKGTVQLGHIPLGPYNAVVSYQGKSTNWATDASSAVQPLTVTVPVAGGGGGTTNNTAVSAVVLLTIFGLAFLLVILAIRVRKPPPPPVFE